METAANLPNDLPEWFCIDKDNGLDNREIQDKIKGEIYNEVVRQECDAKLWDDNFIDEVADMYMKKFEKSYNDFCMKQLSNYMSRNKLLNAFNAHAHLNKPQVTDQQMGLKPNK